MTWAPLIVVSFVVMWLRFKLGERLLCAGRLLVQAFMIEAGTRTLVNGQPVRQSRPMGRLNRAQRRAQR